MSSKLSRRVFVVGVGMHPFGNEGIPATDMGYVAGVAALDDAGIDFPEVGALYNGYLGGGITAGVHLAKDLGLTGMFRSFHSIREELDRRTWMARTPWNSSPPATGRPSGAGRAPRWRFRGR